MTSISRTVILHHSDIELKLERMAWQVLELNHSAEEIVLLGIEGKGVRVAELIAHELGKIGRTRITIGTVLIDKSQPKSDSVTVKVASNLTGKHIILVDDVLNSGRTMMYATMPVLQHDPASLHTAVLANRDHGSFPIKADIVGISMATTLQEHINFTEENGQMTVYLE